MLDITLNIPVITQSGNPFRSKGNRLLCRYGEIGFTPFPISPAPKYKGEFRTRIFNVERSRNA